MTSVSVVCEGKLFLSFESNKTDFCHNRHTGIFYKCADTCNIWIELALAINCIQLTCDLDCSWFFSLIVCFSNAVKF